MIPNVEFFTSSKLKHDINSHFNPPGLTNFIGVVQVENDISAIRGLNFPPFGTSLEKSCVMYVDDQYFLSTNTPVSFTWRPDKITREADLQGIKYIVDTIVIDNEISVMSRIILENRSGVGVTKRLKFHFNGGVTNNNKDWANWIPPHENDNVCTLNEQNKIMIHSSKKENAHLLQGLTGQIESLDRFGITKTIKIPPGEKVEFYYFAVMADNINDGINTYQKLTSKRKELISNNERIWNQEINSIFDQDSSNYSGFLPILSTKNESLLKLYYMGIMGVVYFKRDNPLSTMGRTYDTLMPRYWQTVTFIWDYYLSGTVHAMLDPKVMKKYIQKWMKMDIHTCFGSEYISGKPVGPWYSINDHAMVMMIKELLDWTGDYDWLLTKVNKSKTAFEFLEEYANHYKKFLKPSGLADYGGINNLLECVSTYTHEVASLNSANIANLNYLSNLYGKQGDLKKSRDAKKAAKDIFDNLANLYVEGRGYWKAGQPDGSQNEVMHAYDFFTVINTIGDMLPIKQKEEMVAFFENDLKTSTWMRSLSVKDPNAMFSVRPDHQWNGAYPAWPSQSLMALIRAGKKELALSWIDGLSKSANQGPFGQAHFTETIMKTDQGGARKSSAEEPWIVDWTCSSNGNWAEAVLKGFAGISIDVNEGIKAKPIISDLELHGINFNGMVYNLTKKGLKKV